VTDKRPYLRGDARRQQLLDAAGRVFSERGLPGISIIAVAEEAGVSRRLVYDHFADLEALYNAFLLSRLVNSAAMLDAIHSDPGAGLVEVAVKAFDAMSTMPADDLRAFQIVYADANTVELAAARSYLRERVTGRWSRFVPEGAPAEAGHALIWIMLGSMMELVALVRAGELPREQAVGLVRAMFSAAPSFVLTDSVEQNGSSSNVSAPQNG